MERSVQKIGRNLIAAAFSSWKVHVAKVRWLKYREDQIMSRHKDRLLSRVLSNWKDATSSAVVQVTVAEDKYRQKVQTIVLKSFLVLKEHCTEQAIVRDKLFKSVNMHVDTLQRRAFNALILSAQQRQKFEMSLSGIHATIEFESAKLVLTAWRTLAAARSRKDMSMLICSGLLNPEHYDWHLCLGELRQNINMLSMATLRLCTNSKL